MVRLDSDMTGLEEETVDGGAMVCVVGDRMRHLQPERPVDFEPAPQPVFVPMPADHLARMLMNLLDNARDATEPGGRITVEVRAARPPSSLRCATTAPGVPPPDRDAIFDPCRAGRGARFVAEPPRIRAPLVVAEQTFW
jgi:two-component system OmpR family sensor kinase